MATLEISVVIPTFNRKQYLLETLASLANQTFPCDRFEVIVVDDGSTDGSSEIASQEFPFALRCIRQENQGDALARNNGAKHGRAELLVFLDDDILVEPNYLAALYRAHEGAGNRIVVGTEILWLEAGNPLEEAHPVRSQHSQETELVDVEFPKVCSNNMSIYREAFIGLGMMQNLDFPGSSMWCDADFSYRAQLKGFEFYRSTAAICWHRDYVYRNLGNQIRRWREASYRAVPLFQKYPDLIQYLPMFSDKTPINWSHDAPALILRKSVRWLASLEAFLWLLEKAFKVLNQLNPSGRFLEGLRRWIIGGYIYRGYRDGLRENPSFDFKTS